MNSYITTIWLPIAITLGWLVGTCISVDVESKKGRDYSIPIFTMLSFALGLGATLGAWLLYAVS
jgi:membrane protein DedA with SNARE-associated domain